MADDCDHQSWLYYGWFSAEGAFYTRLCQVCGWYDRISLASIGRVFLNRALNPEFNTEFDSLFQVFCGSRWRLARAIAIVESGLNPWAADPKTGAVGLMKQTLKFSHQWGKINTELRWLPPIQLQAFRNFLDAHVGMDDFEVAGRYKLTDAGWECVPDAAADYIAKVKAYL